MTHERQKNKHSNHLVQEAASPYDPTICTLAHFQTQIQRKGQSHELKPFISQMLVHKIKTKSCVLSDSRELCSPVHPARGERGFNFSWQKLLYAGSLLQNVLERVWVRGEEGVSWIWKGCLSASYTHKRTVESSIKGGSTRGEKVEGGWRSFHTEKHPQSSRGLFHITNLHAKESQRGTWIKTRSPLHLTFFPDPLWGKRWDKGADEC